jgi:hypothetical protein
MPIFSRKKLGIPSQSRKESVDMPTPVCVVPPINGKAALNGKAFKNGKAKEALGAASEHLRVTLERLDQDTTAGLDQLTAKVDAMTLRVSAVGLAARTVRGKRC